MYFVAIREILSKINRIASLCKTVLIFGLVFYLCFLFFLVKQPNWPGNFFSYSIIDNPLVLLSNSSDSPTEIDHLLFGLVGSEEAYHHKKDYMESWWRPNQMRGYLNLDKAPTEDLLPWSSASPPYRVSDDLTEFLRETNIAAPIMIRMARGIMETVRENRVGFFRWLVMGKDDTIFFVDNIIDILAKYDHTKYYYFGGQAEFVLSNYRYSFNMGFGGAGYIFSYPLAKALADDMESCLRRYAHLNGTDLIIMSCIADFGVDLSPEKGMHQIDLRDNIAGFLSSHPKTLLMSLHHFDMVDPIFPNMNRSQSTRHLMKPANVDQSRLLQQTICYNRKHSWSISISWGYSVHIYEKIMPRSWLQLPIETFAPWAPPNPDPPHYMFNTRLPNNDPCDAPHLFFFESIERMSEGSIITIYNRSSQRELPPCLVDENGNHSADFVSAVHVYSPGIKRIEIDKCECCDIAYADGTSDATVTFRECMPDEMVA